MRKLAAARADLDAARWDESASRAYYAMFHAARALLAARGLSARTHSGLAAVFAEHFVRTGAVDARLGRWLGQGRRARELGDYDDFLELEPEEARESVDRAASFVDASRTWLSAQGVRDLP
jgi:uncharacterized protein (UPF0332 family)